jgi:hypothetical protein
LEEIIETQVEFYKNLYTEGETDQDAQKEILSNIKCSLDQQSMSKCEGFISEEEIDKALKSFENNKSPGSYGLSKEFYQCFWDILKSDLLEVLNSAFKAGTLADSQREAIMTLLYKSGEKEDIKNWRPISLLKVDYKLLAKCIANRIKNVMNKIISEDQTNVVCLADQYTKI